MAESEPAPAGNRPTNDERRALVRNALAHLSEFFTDGVIIATTWRDATGTPGFYFAHSGSYYTAVGLSRDVVANLESGLGPPEPAGESDDQPEGVEGSD